MSQEENTQNDKSTLIPGFGDRFIRVFGDLKQSEIAALLKVQPSAITNYTKDRVPKAHILIKVWEYTKCDLHWLLTGENIRSLSFELPVPFDADQRRVIEQLAEDRQQSVEQVISELLTEALEARGLAPKKAAPPMLLFRQDIQLKAIPLVGSISSDRPITFFEEQRDVLVAEVFIPNGHQSFVLQVVGDKWKDEGFRDGDYIVCCDNKQPKSGEVVVAIIDGSATTVKRIFFEQGKIRLQSANGSGDSQTYSPDRVELFATVTGVQRNP